MLRVHPSGLAAPSPAKSAPGNVGSLKTIVLPFGHLGG